MKVSDRLQVDAFTMRIGDIKDVALDQLHALSISVGWPHRAEDWQFLRETGHGIVALDEIGRVMGSGMWFPHGERFATIGMVITSPRLQTNGTGQWLMNHILSEVSGRRLSLSATRAARRLYFSLDFRPEKTVFQCQGTARMREDVAPANGVLRELGTADLTEVCALDAAGFGIDRTPLMTRLAAQSVAYGLFRENGLRAFACCRPFGRGHVVGPVVASNDADAIAVVSPHVQRHRGRFLRLDTRRESGEFASYLSQSGLQVYDTVLTMSFGKSLAAQDASASEIYALATQALG